MYIIIVWIFSRKTCSNPITPTIPNKPVYDGNDEFGGNYIFVDNLSPEARRNLGFTLPGTPIYVIDKEISRTKPEMYVIDIDKFNDNKEMVTYAKDDIKNFCDTVINEGAWDIGLTGLRVEIQKLFSMFFNTEFLFNSGKFSSNTMKAIKAVLENDHANNLLKSNSYRLVVGYYLAICSYIDEAMEYLNKADNLLSSSSSYANSSNQYYEYMRKAEKYIGEEKNIYYNKSRITELFNKFAIYETATTLAGAATDTLVDKADKKFLNI